MFNDCQQIDDFYKSLKASEKYEQIISQHSRSVFGGTKSSHTVPTSGGFVKVRCDQGLNTLYWSTLHIMFLGSIKGSNKGIYSEGSFFFAKSIIPLDQNGLFQLVTLASVAKVQLPFPNELNKK